MKTYRSTSGPFIERPFYTPNEVELICIDELRKVDLLPSVPKPIRVDRFIEKRFKIHHSYEDLPDGVLGCIEFGPKGVEAISVSRLLSDDSGSISERRINTTLAHEAGHGLLHTHLFAFGENLQALFENNIDSNKPKILCRKDTIQGIQEIRRRDYSWFEYQANLVIGSLLLPRTLVMTSLEPFLIKEGKLGYSMLDRSRHKEAVRALSHTFDVNPIVARIRLDSLFPPAQDFQLTL